MLEVCENEMTSIIFFGITKERMVHVRMFLEKRFESGNTVPGTRASHHFVLLSSAKVGHRLTSEEESFIDIHNFNLPTIFNMSDFTPSTYVTCTCNSFWWVGIITMVDKEAGDVKIDFMHPNGPRKTFNWPQHTDTCYVPIKNIIHKIAAPTTSTGRTYKIDEDDYQKTVSVFTKLKSI